jgi:hypothetical protein
MRTYVVPFSTGRDFNWEMADVARAFVGGLEALERRTEGALDEEDELVSESESDSDEDVDAEELFSDDESSEEDEEEDEACAGILCTPEDLGELGANFAFFRGGGPGDGDLPFVIESDSPLLAC